MPGCGLRCLLIVDIIFLSDGKMVKCFTAHHFTFEFSDQLRLTLGPLNKKNDSDVRLIQIVSLIQEPW